MNPNATQPHSVDIGVVSCGRLHQLKRLFASLQSNQKPVQTLIISLQGNTDAEAVREQTTDMLPGMNVKIINNPVNLDWVGGVNQCVSHSKSTYFMFLNEDMECTSNSVSNAIEHHQRRFGKSPGLITFSDGLQGGYIACAGLLNKTLISELGGSLLHTGYEHYYADVELTLHCCALNMYEFARDVIIWHRHEGSQNTEANSERYQVFMRDEELFLKRRQQCFDNINHKEKFPPLDQDIRYLHYMAHHLRRSGKQKEAINAYRDVLATETNEPEWYHAAAHAWLAYLLNSQHPIDAQTHARACLTLNPNDQRMRSFVSESNSVPNS